MTINLVLVVVTGRKQSQLPILRCLRSRGRGHCTFTDVQTRVGTSHKILGCLKAGRGDTGGQNIYSKCNSHSWDILPETWDMTPCFRVTIPGSWVYILVKKCRSQVRLFGKNQVYLVEVITIFCLFDTLSLRLI